MAIIIASQLNAFSVKNLFKENATPIGMSHGGDKPILTQVFLLPATQISPALKAVFEKGVKARDSGVSVCGLGRLSEEDCSTKNSPPKRFQNFTT